METVKENKTNEPVYTLPEGIGAIYQLKKDPQDKNELVTFKYHSRKQISPNTYIFTYLIPNDMNLGINLGQHIAIE